MTVPGFYARAVKRILEDKLRTLAERSGLGDGIKVIDPDENSFFLDVYVSTYGRNKWLPPVERCLERLRTSMFGIGLALEVEPKVRSAGYWRYVTRTVKGDLIGFCESNGWSEELRKYAKEAELASREHEGVSFIGIVSVFVLALFLFGLVAWGVWGRNWGPFVFIGCPLIAVGLWELEWVQKSVKFVLTALLFGLIAYAALALKFWGVTTRGDFW